MAQNDLHYYYHNAIAMTFKRTVLLALSTCFGISLSAQQTALERAGALYNEQKVDSALFYYEQALSQTPTDKNLQLKMAELYLQTNRPKKAAQYYGSLIESPNAGVDLYFWYAYALQMDGRYQKAKEVHEKAKKHPDMAGNYAALPLLDAYIASCDFALKHQGKRPVFDVRNETAVNTSAADFNPVFAGDQIYFASKRIVQDPMGIGGYSDANEDYLYQADRQNNRDLKNAETVFPKGNMDFTNRYKLSPVSSLNGLTFVSGNNFSAAVRHPMALGGGSSSFKMGYYNAPLASIPPEDPTEFPHYANQSAFPALSDGGKTLYFAAKGLPGSYGGFDLYVSYFKEGRWTTPQNLGPNVNSIRDEISPFVDSKGILYFSSDGKPGFGGFDVYRAENVAGSWKKVRNMGPNLNSSQDDVYFIFEPEKNMGYLASNREGGQGDYDIYSAYLQGNVEGMPLISSQEEDYVVKNPEGQSGLTKEQEDQLNTLEEIADNVNGGEGNGSNMSKDDINDYVVNPPSTDDNKGTSNNEGYVAPTNNNTGGSNNSSTTNNQNTNNNPYAGKQIPCADNAYIGVVTDAVSKRRLADVWVYVRHLKTGVEYKKQTSKYGEYALILEPQSQYEIRFSAAGYQNDIMEVFTGDGQKRTLLGSKAIQPSATNGLALVNNDGQFMGRSGTQEEALPNQFRRANELPQALMPDKGYLVQVGVFKSMDKELQKELGQYANLLTAPYKNGEAKIYRLGVFADKAHADEVLAKVQGIKGLNKSFLKTEALSNRTAAERMTNNMQVVFPLKKEVAEVNPPAVEEKPANNTNKEELPPIVEDPRNSYADNQLPEGTTARGGASLLPAERPLEFKVQLGAYKDASAANYPDLSQIGRIERQLNPNNGLTYFYLGGYSNIDDARKADTEVKQKGLKSFIVAFKDGNKIPVSQAVKLAN
ncbi:tetratricopeptide repeat protein [Saprospira sp. CCB-QB6]|uniref:tetratricopeptide repeat protein n=1 Tax=Saprospira sp. CCB-QB6 TaxID=3023936 RepID=UPI00234A64F0|nr:tetratricopeptide repeat protein [Saprospira sp. CCB-QB6]WCL81901.1 tetratricopeptide repeat protein [Saprospira sp. CCB-QB6]